MSVRCLVLFSIFLLSGLQSFGAVTLVSISGASNQDLSTPTKPVIYAGFAGTCTGDSSSTCDSCTGEAIAGSKLWPCNKQNAYPSLKLNIRLQTTNTSLTAATAFVKIGDEKYSPSTAQTMSDGILTTQLTWSEICSHSKVNKGAQCDGGSFTVDLSVGFDPSTGGATAADAITFKLAARVVATNGSEHFYTDCNTQAATGNIGFCHFEAYPGDGKIYADNLVVASGYPASPATAIEYSNVAFFYEQQLGGEDDNTTIQRISNASSYYALGVNKSASPPVADNRIDGLSNDTRYCMVMANQDITGVVSYFTPLPGTSGSPVTAAELCTSPSEVVGLLDDKHCFIATAAFGSNMAPEVQTFRDFRNQYLLSHDLGRDLVKFYYKHSPFYAHLIAQSDFARALVRGILWPILLFAHMSVSAGLGVSLFLFLLAALSCVAIWHRWLLQRRLRGDL